MGSRKEKRWMDTSEGDLEGYKEGLQPSDRPGVCLLDCGKIA